MIFAIGDDNCGVDEGNRFHALQLSRCVTPRTKAVHEATIRVEDLYTIVTAIRYNNETLKIAVYLFYLFVQEIHGIIGASLISVEFYEFSLKFTKFGV